MAGPGAVVGIWLIVTVARIWPAPKAQYAVARRVSVGQARRWRALSERARIKQARFTI